MSAPNTPVATRGKASRALATRPSKSSRASAGAAAGVKLGRVPLRVSAASVNCGTSSRPASPAPAASSTRLRFMRPRSSGNTRKASSRDSNARACAGVSSRSAHTSTMRPRPISPTTAPSTSTRARAARCSKPITAAQPTRVTRAKRRLPTWTTYVPAGSFRPLSLTRSPSIRTPPCSMLRVASAPDGTSCA